MSVDSHVTAAWLARREAERLREAQHAVEQMRRRLPAAAELLRTRFGAGRVWLFGSFAGGRVHPDSDVDLLVEGLAPTQLFKATAELMPVLSSLVHLVRAEEAPASLLERVRAEGLPL